MMTFFPNDKEVQHQTSDFGQCGQSEQTAVTKPLRAVVLYSAGHLGSALILNALLDCKELNIVGVVKARPMPFTAKGLAALKRHLNKVGWRFGWLLFWQRCVQGCFFLLGLLLPWRKRRLQPAWKLARSHGIRLFKCKSINDDNSAQFIEACKPDLIISAYFNQILKPHILSLPTQGVLNVHPGWLPAYRGAMAYFWVLKEGEEQAGVTVHWMDEGIDTGEIIARETFTLTRGMTQQNVLSLTAKVGADMLQRIIKKLYRGQAVETLRVDEQETMAYHGMPAADDFEYYCSTNRFFRIRDTLKIFFKNI